MSKPEPAAARHRLLITLNRICAWGSLLAALLLYTGVSRFGVPGNAAAPWHEPIIVHSVLTALLLFWGNALLKEQSVSAGAFSAAAFLATNLMWTFAATDIQLAIEALFRLDSVLALVMALLGLGAAWAVALVLPGALLGWSFFALLPKRRKSAPPENDQPKDKIEQPNTRTLLAVERSRTSMHDPWQNFFYGLASLPVFGVIAFVPFSWSDLLRTAIFKRQFSGWPALLESVGATLGEHAAYFGVISIVMVAALGAVAVDAWLRARRIGTRGPRDSKRDLVPNELAFIEQAAESVTAYAAPFNVRWVREAYYPMFMLAIIVAIYLLMFFGVGGGLGADRLEAWRTRGLEWYLYINERGPGDALLIVSGLVATFSIPFVLGSVWRRFAIMGALGFRRSKLFPDDPFFHYRLAVATDVRRGVLIPGARFDPEAYVYNDFRRFARNWYAFAGILIALNVFFLYLDRMHYDLFTEKYIETSGYWTAKVRRLKYGDVDRVEIACAEGRDYHFELSYVLKFEGGRTIRPIDFDLRGNVKALPGRLDAWIRVDAKLRAAGVPVRHAVRVTKQGRTPRFNESKCRDELKYYVGKRTREKIMPLLRESGAPITARRD